MNEDSLKTRIDSRPKAPQRLARADIASRTKQYQNFVRGLLGLGAFLAVGCANVVVDSSSKDKGGGTGGASTTISEGSGGSTSGQGGAMETTSSGQGGAMETTGSGGTQACDTFVVKAVPQSPQNAQQGATNVTWFCYDVTAPNCSDITVKSVTEKKIGPSDENDVQDLTLQADGTVLSGIENIGSDWTVIFNNLSVTVPAGKTRTLCTHGNVSPFAMVNNEVGFEVASPEDIIAIDKDAKSVKATGVFPVKGGLTPIVPKS